MPKVLVLCDQPVLKRGLLHVLTSEGFAIAAADTPPDLILLDITAGLTIADLTDLHSRMPDCPVVLWCDAMPQDFVFRTLKLGVRGMVPRTSQADLLCDTLKKVASGEIQNDFGPRDHSAQPGRQHALTPRERELIRRLRDGLRNKQIAAEMNITEGTVKIYLFRLFHKMGVRTRFELARWATDQTIR